jgi:transmembrane sensor
MTRKDEEVISIAEQATRWWDVLRTDEASAADKREFASWVVHAPEHVEATLRMERVYRALARPGVHWPDTTPETLTGEAKAASDDVVLPMPLRTVTRPKPRRRPAMWLASALAAALLLTVGVSWLALSPPHQFQTRVGEQRSVMLADGSRITLNTASRVEVRLGTDRRTIELLEGEALFDVAPDAKRPFEVRVGNVLVRAVGTEFDIDRRASHTVVTVLEGRVSVVPTGARANDSRELSMGERLVIDRAGLGQIRKRIDLNEVTAWTRHELVFRRRALGEIADEFNRYNLARLEIRSPTLQRREVTGIFRTDDLGSFVAILARSPGVKVAGDDRAGYIVTFDESAVLQK